MKFLFNLFLLYPFLVFNQNEVKIEFWDNGKVLSQVEYTPDGKLFSESSIILGIENRKIFNNDGTVQSKLLNGC